MRFKVFELRILSHTYLFASWLFALLLFSCNNYNDPQQFVIDGFKFHVKKDGTLEIIKGSEIKTGDLIIPEQVTYRGKTYTVTSIGEFALAYHSNLTSVMLPPTVKRLESHCFAECTMLQNFIETGSLEFIGEWAFFTCNALETFTIGESVSSINPFAFAACQRLKQFVVHKKNNYFSTTDGILMNHNKTTIVRYPPGKHATSYTIPEGIKTIYDSAFSLNENLVEVTFPNTLTTIETYAFDGCSKLREVKFPNSLMSIGNGAFYLCYSLVKAEIPASVKSIGDYAFYGCEAMKDFVVSPQSSAYSSIDGILFNKDATVLIDYPAAKPYTEYVVPKSVKKIEKSVFSHNQTLTSIVLPDGLTSICDYAFSSCHNLSKINIPETVKNIEKCAFYCCCKLTRIDLPQSIETISNYCFYKCSSLKHLKLPNSVKLIESSAFAHCTDLAYVVLPENLTRIDDFSFYNCTNLTDIVLPNTTDYIGKASFGGNEKLKSIYCKSKKPLDIDINTFSDVDRQKCSIYVPKGCSKAYETKEIWQDFKNISELAIDMICF